MKAKEYVAKYGDKMNAINVLDPENSTPEERRAVCCELEFAVAALWVDFVNDFKAVAKARNISTEAGLDRLAKEFNEKWNAINTEMIRKYGPNAKSLKEDCFWYDYKRGAVETI